MAKWYGKVGYIITEEAEPGRWIANPIEKPYFGDVLSISSRWTPSTNVNDNLDISKRISIVADPFAYQNFTSIKYVEFMGALWDVTSVEPQYPRLILNIGGVYNGETPEATE